MTPDFLEEILSYTCTIPGPKRQRYTSNKLDFFAVYLVPIDVWYIIPFEIVRGNHFPRAGGAKVFCAIQEPN